MKSFSITIIIIVIIINIPVIIRLNLYLVSLLWDILVFIILSLFIYLFCFCLLFILNSFLLHFPTFISYFDLFLFSNFVIPISPPTFYYFKCYPYWPYNPPRRTHIASEISGELKSLLSLLLCQLQFYRFC